MPDNGRCGGSAIPLDITIRWQPVVVTEQRPPGIRDDLWNLVQADVAGSREDSAISTAFRHIETVIQRRSGHSGIGSGLIEATFGSRIVFSNNTMDELSIQNLFKGAMGFYKGSRSHGASPSIPVVGREKLISVLSIASALLDLLDYDSAVRPAILSYGQRGTFTEFFCNNIDLTSELLIAGASVRIASRRNRYLIVDAAELPTGESIAQVVTNDVESLPFSFLVEPDTTDAWHRVVEANVTLYFDEAGNRRRPEFGVLLDSQEGGRIIRRCFPTVRHYDVGDYVTWDWSYGTIVGEA
jgi:hypothetical protein